MPVTTAACYRFREDFGIVAVVIPELKFLDVQWHIFGADLVERADHAALHQRPWNVVTLMDALRRSVAEEKRSTAPAKKGRKRVPGQGEMLRPIPGKKAKEAAASKPVARPGTRQKKAG